MTVAVVSEPGAARPVTPMSILTDMLARLDERADSLVGLDPSLRLDLRAAAELAHGLDPYLERWTSPESPALNELATATQAEDWNRHAGRTAVGHLEQEMLSGHLEGQLLKMLVHSLRARRVLEIGLFTGYSALAMAEALPADGEVIACEIDPDVAAFARRRLRESPSGAKVDVRVGPAGTTLAELASSGEVFELVFIDADKAGYLDYVDAVLNTGLLAPHGLICVDNTLMQGQPWRPEVATANGVAIEAFNRAVAADCRVEQVIIPLRDGVTLIRRVDLGS